MPPSTESLPPAQLPRTLGFWGVMGQSISGVAPTTTPTINVALVFVAAGSGSWLAYVIATLAILLVALNLAPLAQAFSGAGSLSEFVRHGLGDTGRLVTAWSLLLAYLAISVATLAACTSYLTTLFAAVGFTLPNLAGVGLAGALAAVCAWRDVRMSTGLMLALETTSIVLVFLLGLIILVHQGIASDVSQFHLTGLTPGGLSNGLLIGVLSFVGFEAAAALGDEAKAPLRSIPRALILTPLLTGVFFVFAAYVIVLGFNRYDIAVATSDAPLDDLARALHRPGLGLLVAAGAAISLFGCVIATMVAASRLTFALARQGSLPVALARIHPRHSTPQHAVALSVGIILPAALGLATFAKPLDIYNWLGTFGTFGCVTAYALSCLAAPIFLHRTGRLRPQPLALSGLALAVLGYVIFGSLYPVPAAPMNFIPWLFAGLLAAGTGFSHVYSRQSVAIKTS